GLAPALIAGIAAEVIDVLFGVDAIRADRIELRVARLAGCLAGDAVRRSAYLIARRRDAVLAVAEPFLVAHGIREPQFRARVVLLRVPFRCAHFAPPFDGVLTSRFRCALQIGVTTPFSTRTRSPGRSTGALSCAIAW